MLTIPGIIKITDKVIDEPHLAKEKSIRLDTHQH